MKRLFSMLYILLSVTIAECAYSKNSTEWTQYEQGILNVFYLDYDKAMAALRPLAENGKSRAARLIGGIHHYGLGVHKDTKEARKWYLMALKIDNDSRAKNSIGLTYKHDGDTTRAMRWFREAANDGNADAYHNIARYYSAKKDNQEAAKWYQKAADNNHAGSQHDLAQLYRKGLGVEKDPRIAFKLFRAAANQNISYSQYNLASMYFDMSRSKYKKWIPRRNEFRAEAYVWLTLAKVNGIDQATAALSKVKSSMSDETVANAEKLLATRTVIIYTSLFNRIRKLTGTSERFISAMFEDNPEKVLPFFEKMGIPQ